QRATNPRAALALDLFCYQARKWIGALAAALGGLDTLVFSRGIGENSPEVRSEICRELGHLGVTIDDAQNKAAASVISRSESRVTARVIPTDEELMMANIVERLVYLVRPNAFTCWSYQRCLGAWTQKWFRTAAADGSQSLPQRSSRPRSRLPTW